MPQTPFYPPPCPWPVRPADVPKPVMTVNNKRPDEHGNVEVEGGGGGGGDVKHSDFADMQPGGKMDLDTVNSKVDTLIRKLKGTAAFALALLSLSSFGYGPTTRFGAVHPDTTLREVVVAGGVPAKVSDLTNDAEYVTASVTNGFVSTNAFLSAKVSAFTNDAGYVTSAVVDGLASTGYVNSVTADLRRKDDDQTYVPMPRGPFAAFSHEYSVTVAAGSQPVWVPPAVEGEMGHFSWSMTLKDGDAVVASGEFVSDPFPDDTPSGFVMHREQGGTTYYVNAERAMVLEPDGDRYARYGETDSRFSAVEKDVADRRVKDDMSVWSRGHSDVWEWDGFDKSVLEITGAPHLEDDHGTTYLYCDARYVPTYEALNLKSVFPCDASTFDTVLEAPVAGRTVGAHFFRREIWVESDDRLATTGGVHTVATNRYTKAETDAKLGPVETKANAALTRTSSGEITTGDGSYQDSGIFFETQGGDPAIRTGSIDSGYYSTLTLQGLFVDGEGRRVSFERSGIRVGESVLPYEDIATKDDLAEKADKSGDRDVSFSALDLTAQGDVMDERGNVLSQKASKPFSEVTDGNLACLDSSGDLRDSGIHYSMIDHLESDKADRPASSTAGNLASLTEDGDLEDSGIAKTNVATLFSGRPYWLDPGIVYFGPDVSEDEPVLNLYDRRLGGYWNVAEDLNVGQTLYVRGGIVGEGLTRADDEFIAAPGYVTSPAGFRTLANSWDVRAVDWNGECFRDNSSNEEIYIPYPGAPWIDAIRSGGVKGFALYSDITGFASATNAAFASEVRKVVPATAPTLASMLSDAGSSSDTNCVACITTNLCNLMASRLSATNETFAAEVRSVVIETLKESLKIVQKSDGYHLVIEE